MAVKVFCVLSLLLLVVYATDSFGDEISSSHDNFIQFAGGISDGVSYSSTVGTEEKLRYLGHHFEAGHPYVLAFTPQCIMQDTMGTQTCGLHTLKITGETTAGVVTELDATSWGQGSSSYQWASTNPPLLTVDTGNELDWTSATVNVDFYNTVWAVDAAGGLYHTQACGSGNNINFAFTHPWTWRPLCPFAASGMHANMVTVAAGNVQAVSSGGYYSTNYGDCNVAIIVNGQAYWGATSYSGLASYCKWAQVPGVPTGVTIISVANALDTLFLVTSDHYIYYYDGLLSFATTPGNDGTAPDFSRFTNISSEWHYLAGVYPVYIDAWDTSKVRVVAADGSLFSWSASANSFNQISPLPCGSSCGVYICSAANSCTTYVSGNPTQAYMSVGPEAVYFTDNVGASSGFGSTSTNNWRLAY